MLNLHHCMSELSWKFLASQQLRKTCHMVLPNTSTIMVQAKHFFAHGHLQKLFDHQCSLCRVIAGTTSCDLQPVDLASEKKKGMPHDLDNPNLDDFSGAERRSPFWIEKQEITCHELVMSSKPVCRVLALNFHSNCIYCINRPGRLMNLGLYEWDVHGQFR